MNREQLITRIKSVIYQNDNNEIDAQKHQDLEIEIVNALLDAVANIAGGFLGTIRADAPAPTPHKNGYYIFSTSGQVPYIQGTPTVSIGDWLSVNYEGLNHIYTNVGKLLNLSDAFDVTNSNIGASLKALYDGLNNLKTTLRGATTMTIAQVEDAITVAVERIDNIDTKLTLNDSDIVSIARMTITEPQPANQSRSQVPMNRRLRGFVLSRVDMSNSDVVEKYIGPGYGTTEWVKDSNWITLETKNNKNAANGYAGLDANKQLANELINTNFRKGFGYMLNSNVENLVVPNNDKLNLGTDDFTIQASFKCMDKSQVVQVIYQTISTSDLAKYGIVLVNGTIAFVMWNATSSLSISTPFTITNGVNYNVFAIRKGLTLYLYVNGVLVASALRNEIVDLNFINKSTRIGSIYASEDFSGNISLIRLFNRALSQADVTYYENNGRPDLQRLKYEDTIDNYGEQLKNTAFTTTNDWSVYSTGTLTVSNNVLITDCVGTSYQGGATTTLKNVAKLGKKFRIKFNVNSNIAGSPISGFGVGIGQLHSRIGYSVNIGDNTIVIERLIKEIDNTNFYLYPPYDAAAILKYSNPSVVQVGCVLELLPENALPTQWLESQNSLNATANGNPAINTETPVTDYSIVDNITNNIAVGTANRDYTLPAGYIVDSVCVNSTVALTALQLVNVTNSETLLTGKTVSASANKHLPITADQSSSKVDTTLRLNCAGNTGLGFNIVINIKKCL